MFNHDPSPNAEWYRNAADHAFHITASRDLPRGQEILISYGGKTNEQLLTRYGFVYADNQNDAATPDVRRFFLFNGLSGALNSY